MSETVASGLVGNPQTISRPAQVIITPNSIDPKPNIWRILFFGGAFVILIGILLTLLLLVRAPHTTSIQPVDRIASISGCVERYAPKLKALESGGADTMGAFTLCYNITAAALLADEQFNRNENLAFQMSENLVLMWMVVVITVSGVLLAGLQLFASFRLASVGKGVLSDGGSLKLENGNVVIQSSVVGVIILAISFAFFMVFVRDVYSITEMPGSAAPQFQAARQPPTANMGRAITPAPTPAPDKPKPPILLGTPAPPAAPAP